MTNPIKGVLKPDICIIGAGSAGLSLASAAAQLGADVVLLERHKMGGDCLNYGCVPSKALLAAANLCHTGQAATAMGLSMRGTPDYAKAMRHVRRAIATIAPHDSVERFQNLGVHVIQEEGRFVSPKELRAGRHRIMARHFVIATGSKAFVPPIEGLDKIAYLTNETLFSKTTAPKHLTIIGGGPIGVEMAQAHARLGVKVSLFEALKLLPRDDAQLAAIVRTQLKQDGVAIYENTAITKLQSKGGNIHIQTKSGRKITASHVLVATGRRPHLAPLHLEAAGIAYTPKGVTVNNQLRSSNRRVWAIGDAAGGPQFTHAANYQAGLLVRNILFRLRAKANHYVMPHVTYTSPELAQLGPLETTLAAQGVLKDVLTFSFADNDRAVVEGDTLGLVKLCVGRRARVLSVGIVGRGAGDMLLAWGLLMTQGLPLSKMAGLTVPYPTRAEASKYAAGAYYAKALFAPRTKKLVRLLKRR